MVLHMSHIGQHHHAHYGHWADDICKHILSNENVWITIHISLTYILKGSVYNNSALVQTMAWRRTGDKPLSQPMVAYFCIVYMRHSASMS